MVTEDFDRNLADAEERLTLLGAAWLAAFAGGKETASIEVKLEEARRTYRKYERKIRKRDKPKGDLQ